MGGVEAGAAGKLQRQRQEHAPAGVSRPMATGARRVHGLGDGEGRAVGEDAAGRGHGDAAGLDQRRVEGQRPIAPALQPPGLQHAAQQGLGVAVLLLEVLGTEEEALRPEHPVAAAHSLRSRVTTSHTPRPDAPERHGGGDRAAGLHGRDRPPGLAGRVAQRGHEAEERRLGLEGHGLRRGAARGTASWSMPRRSAPSTAAGSSCRAK